MNCNWSKFSTKHLVLSAAIKCVCSTAQRFLYPYSSAFSKYLGCDLQQFSYIQFLHESAALILPFTGIARPKKIAIIGVFLSGIFTAFTAILPKYSSNLFDFFISHLQVMLIGMTLAGCGYFHFSPNLHAYIAGHVPSEKMPRVTGFIEISWSMSTLIGLPLVGFFISRVSMPIMLATLGGIITIFGIIGIFLYPPDNKITKSSNTNNDSPKIQNPNETGVPLEEISNPPKEIEVEEKVTLRSALIKYLILLKKAKVWCLLLFATLFMTANTLIFALYGIWFEEKFGFTIEQIGLASISIGVSEFLGSSGTMSIAERIGVVKSVTIGCFISTIGFILIAFLGGYNFILSIAILFFNFLSFEFTIVCSFTVWMRSEAERKAAMMSICYFSLGLGRMCGSLISPTIWRKGELLGLGLLGACFTALSIILLYVAVTLQKREIKT